MEYFSASNGSKKALVTPTDASRALLEDIVIFPEPLLLAMLGTLICLDIVILEFEVLIIDIFFFGSCEYKPPLVRLVILGTFILNDEFVDIPDAKILSSFTPVTPTPNGESVKI